MMQQIFAVASIFETLWSLSLTVIEIETKMILVTGFD